MRFGIVSRFLSVIVLLISANMLFPLAWAAYDDTADAKAFMLSMVVGVAFALLLYAAGQKAHPKDMGTREAFAAVALAWVFASLQGCLPYLIGGYAPSFSNAYFEAMSGFTTTGATIFSDIEILPRGILLWRAQTQWLGGMGIVVLTIALLPMLGMSTTQLFKAEAPGPVLEKISPRIQVVAMMLWAVYMCLTFAGTALLTAGGMDFYESICHIFAAVATGGFSTRNASVGEFNSAYIDWILTAVMFLAGMNFNLHLLALKNRSVKPYRDSEFRCYLTIVLAAVAMIAYSIHSNGFYGSLHDSLRYAAFQVVSIMTTTGFITVDYGLWPTFCQMLLITLMIIGGCAGSTSGAIKCVRVQIVAKHTIAELKRFIHPNAVIPVKMGEETVSASKAASAATFIALYMLIFGASALAVSATGEDVVTSISGVAATLGNVGPGLGAVGPVSNFFAQATAAKWVYIFCMLCGRLELYTVLVLFSRDTWRR